MPPKISFAVDIKFGRMCAPYDTAGRFVLGTAAKLNLFDLDKKNCDCIRSFFFNANQHFFLVHKNKNKIGTGLQNFGTTLFESMRQRHKFEV